MLGDKAAEGEGPIGRQGRWEYWGAMVIGGEGDRGEGNRIQTHRWAGAEKNEVGEKLFRPQKP